MFGWELLLMSLVSFEGDENVLKLNGDGCTTL